jgi:PKD repeat protein
MNKNLLTTSCVALLFAGSVAQNLKVQPTPIVTPSDPHQHQNAGNYVRCASLNPGGDWDAGFNSLVQQYAENLAQGKTTAANYTIAVVYHIIHNNETVGGSGSYNLSQAQINSQTTILNADYAGTNSDISQVPSAFQTVKAGNCNITFCMALKDPSGNTLTEPGIDRINRNTKGWTAPPYSQSYIDATIKPNSIWDPTKYLNIWSCNLSGGLLGYATFPAASGLTGIPGSLGTSSTDGVVLLGSALGNTGFQSTTQYNKGRSGTHEVGHWLGLRHIWGDGNCVTDYCADTPPAEGSHFGCISPSTPYHVNQCGTGQSPNGEMTMNYMDYTDDACMFMFSLDQRTRMQTCMANGTYRSPLTGNSASICSGTSSTPVASFNFSTPVCAGTAKQFTDASSGPPTSWAWSVSPSTGVVITTATSQNPTITFPSAGTYTVTLQATNSQGSNSTSQAVTVTTCTSSSSGCDTLSNINSTDTLAMYLASSGGYWTGTNGYQFSDIAEFYQKTQFATNLNQVTGGIILFYRNGVKGTKGTGTVTLSMNTSATGPGTVLASKAFTISTATTTTAVQNVPYAGNPSLSFSSAIIIPYVAMFTAPGSLTNDFFLSLTVPTGGTDTVAVMTGRRNHGATNTGWIKYQGSWVDLQTATTSTASPSGSKYNIGLIPIACSSTGLQDQSYLGHNINLFPNPSNGYFNFAIALDRPVDLTFEVINPLGQVMATRSESKFVNGVVTYDFSALGRGVYFVRITDSENNKTVKKIMIE